jgi:hypothetical protein
VATAAAVGNTCGKGDSFYKITVLGVMAMPHRGCAGERCKRFSIEQIIFIDHPFMHTDRFGKYNNYSHI